MMPTSKLELAPLILNLVWQVRDDHPPGRPLRVLDVGPGWGKYGVLLHEYVDPDCEVSLVESEQRYNDHPWMATSYDGMLYENDVMDLSGDDLGYFDVVMMIDVIEHLDFLEGVELLQRIPGRVVICTPQAFFQNPEHVEYPTEEHRSHWQVKDFQATGRVEWIDVQLGGIVCRLGRQEVVGTNAGVSRRTPRRRRS